MSEDGDKPLSVDSSDVDNLPETKDAALPDAQSLVNKATGYPVDDEEDVTEARERRVLDNLSTRNELLKAELDLRKQELELRLPYAKAAGVFVIAQVAIADLVFMGYGKAIDWHLPTEAIVAWLSATVVQVIGILYVITRNLFPNRDARPDAGKEG